MKSPEWENSEGTLGETFDRNYIVTPWRIIVRTLGRFSFGCHCEILGKNSKAISGWKNSVKFSEDLLKKFSKELLEKLLVVGTLTETRQISLERIQGGTQEMQCVVAG